MAVQNRQVAAVQIFYYTLVLSNQYECFPVTTPVPHQVCSAIVQVNIKFKSD